MIWLDTAVVVGAGGFELTTWPTGGVVDGGGIGLGGFMMALSLPHAEARRTSTTGAANRVRWRKVLCRVAPG